MNKNKLTAAGFLAAFFCVPLQAQQIEEIVVLGTNSNAVKTDTTLDFSLIETISIDQPFTQGGMGGFAGFRERGAQTIHTTVYRNGMPVNDPSTGWYDFGHIIPTGQEHVTVSHGSNSTLYGSGSLGGTVFIEDNITPGLNIRGGTNSALLSASSQRMNLSYAYGDNGSVMTTNNERDLYKNVTARYKDDYVSIAVTDYRYDYDDCWGTDDCQQQGMTGNVSVRNDNFTLGYSFNNTDFYADGEKTYQSKADNVYFDTRSTFDKWTIGTTYNNGIEVYAMYQPFDQVQLSTRVIDGHTVARVGVQVDKFSLGIGSGYRRPTDYELEGDAWVVANPMLDPEESVGIDIGYGNFSAFRYDFKEGINYDWELAQFINIGKYSTQGIRYSNDWLVFGYTDSDQPYVAKVRLKIKYNWFTYTWTDLGVNTADFSYSKGDWYFTIQDIFNRNYTIIPNYELGGRNFYVGYRKTF